MLDRAYGCLVGAAIGDAMGMPASFMTPGQIKKTYGKITDFLTPAEEQTAHHCLKQGEFTDDTAESLLIAEVLIEAGKFDTRLFIEKMKKWAIEQRMLESTVIGPSTRRFLEAVLHGADYLEAGKLGDTNGGAMRAAPIGIFHHGNLEKAIEDAIASALPSHGSKPGVAATAAVAAAVATAVQGDSTPRGIMEAALYGAERGEKAGFDIPSPSVAARIRLAMEVVEKHQDQELEATCGRLYAYIGAGMKSYESIPLSLGVFYAAAGEVEKGIIAAINLGDDADTNGSITGGLCGAYSGAGKFNPRWIEKIEMVNKLDFKEIATALLR